MYNNETLTVDDIPESSDARVGVSILHEYHDGQWSRLYGVASSGIIQVYPEYTLDSFARELRDAIECAESNGNYYDAECLGALLMWVEDRMNA